jgi:Zinc knuckle
MNRMKAEPSFKEKRKCFKCDKVGHFAKDCFSKVKAGSMVTKPQTRKDSKKTGEGSAEVATYCKAHGNQKCTDCRTTSPIKHKGCAMMSPQVEL